MSIPTLLKGYRPFLGKNWSVNFFQCRKSFFHKAFVSHFQSLQSKDESRLRFGQPSHGDKEEYVWKTKNSVKYQLIFSSLVIKVIGNYYNLIHQLMAINCKNEDLGQSTWKRISEMQSFFWRQREYRAGNRKGSQNTICENKAVITVNVASLL